MSDAQSPPGRTNPRAEALFERGNEAAMTSNYDYAVEMYRDACRLVPDNLVYRQALRGITRRRFNNDPHKVGRLAGAKVQPVRMRIRGEKGKGHWEKVLDMCEDAFQVNPWDVGTSRDAAEAAENLSWWKLACWYIEAVFPQGEADADFLKFAAGIFEGASRFQDAIKCLERVRKINPSDEAVKRQINALDASATIAKSGMQQAIAARAAEPTPSKPAQGGPNVPDDPALDQLKSVAETPLQRLIREVEDEPTRVGNYLELSDYYRQQNKLEEAEKVLAAGRKAIPDDDLLRSAHFEVQLLRLRRAHAHWTKKAELEPDSADIAEKRQAIEEKLNAYELHERKHRAQAEPSNGEVRLAYGICLARLGKHDEAIAEFQQARALGEAPVRTEALHRSGESFEAKGLLKLAERSYQEALKMADTENQTLINTLHYRLGRVAEAGGDLVSAEEHFNEVAANDYTFLDVAERLRALNQKR